MSPYTRATLPDAPPSSTSTPPPLPILSYFEAFICRTVTAELVDWKISKCVVTSFFRNLPSPDGRLVIGYEKAQLSSTELGYTRAILWGLKSPTSDLRCCQLQFFSLKQLPKIYYQSPSLHKG